MIQSIHKSIVFRLFLILLAGTVAIGFSGCKSQKKIAREKAAAERAANIQKAKTDLLAIINDTGHKMTISQKEGKVAEIKGMNLQDAEIDELIVRAEEAIENHRMALKKAEEEKNRTVIKEEPMKEPDPKFDKIEDYFDAIAGQKSLEMANTRINEALKFFASPDVPVLIIIFMEGDIKDYDRPTTIKKYLEYLKDQNKNMNKVHDIKYNENGKITELELIKQ